MTRKDYIIIAEAINAVREQYAPNAQGVIADLTQRIADSLANDNPRFNYNRFITACGI